MGFIIWHELKRTLLKNTKNLFVSALAFAFLCVIVGSCIGDYAYTAALSSEMEESYGDKTFYKIIVNGDDAKLNEFFSGDNVENIRAFFEEMANSDDFEYRWAKTDTVQFFNLEDEDYGADDFPAHPDSCVYSYDDPYIWKGDDFGLTLNAILADRLFGTEPTMSLSSGRWFETDDFYLHSDEDVHYPCILGHEYAGLYELGDEIPYAHVGSVENETLTVIGFLDEGSYFYDNNDEKIILDRYIVIPLSEIGDGFPVTDEDGNYNSRYLGAYNDYRIQNCRIICDTEIADAVRSEVNALCNRLGLYEIRLSDETESATKELASFQKTADSNLAAASFITLMSVIMCIIQMNYKLMQEKKKHGILKLSGITKKQMFITVIADSFLMFILADILFSAFFILNKALGEYGYDAFIRLSWYTFPVILLIELFILAGMGIYGTVKITHMSDLSAALRENE